VANWQNGADDFDRDSLFYDDFVKGDPLLFAVYLAWNHGKNIPAWNSTLLPEDEQLDIGCGGEADDKERGSGGKRGRPPTPAASDVCDPRKLDKMLEIQTKFLEHALSSDKSSSSSASTQDIVHTFAAYEAQLEQLKRFKTDDSLLMRRGRLLTKHSTRSSWNFVLHAFLVSLRRQVSPRFLPRHVFLHLHALLMHALVTFG